MKIWFTSPFVFLWALFQFIANLFLYVALRLENKRKAFAGVSVDNAYIYGGFFIGRRRLTVWRQQLNAEMRAVLRKL